ncbi:MAG TPA: ATP-dependent DNA ligase [Acidobacteriaceae bacterium]|nr:ATP-dependent DNA ligase [Acidobacteriaceae bacterium]
MSAPFLEFAELCEALAATTKKLEKRALIANFLQKLAIPDAALATLYFSGTPFAETDRRALNVGGSLLSKALAEASHASGEAMHATYRRHGDLGAAARDLLADHIPSGPPLALRDIQHAFDTLAFARGPAAKLPILLDLLQRSHPLEAKYLIKLISGDMRTGVKQSLVEEAIAQAYAAETAAVRRAVMLQGDPTAVVMMAAEDRLAQASMKLFHPLGFMLASPVESVEKAIERFREETGATDAPLRRVILEDKYDGIRAQLHCGDPEQPGRVELFSRNREDIGASFPELCEAFAHFDEPVILDGEILAWNSRDARALPFAALQQRLGRKQVSAEMLEQTPVVYVVFDVLYHSGNLLLELPLAERRARLESLIAQRAPATAITSPRKQALLFSQPAPPAFLRLQLAPAIHLESAAQLDRAYTEARQRGNEGVMLKDTASPYQPGRRGLAWLKLKRELATLDVVVTGVEFGHGKRAGVLSDYTFAVRDGDTLKNVGKAYSGLTDSEIADLTAFFHQHTLEDYGHFRTVEPLKVLEVAFNNVMRSGRHNSGFALRFPRILRIRDDKPVAEIDTLARVEEIYNSQPDKMIEADAPSAP